jgi:amino acid adenylation domain-containing protein/non-ribosomal peptide synthase protein (TIGR01720 family)
MRTDNLVERLRDHAATRPDRLALRFVEGDEVVDQLTFAALDLRIRAVAAHLQQLGGAGERAVILLPSGFNYAVAFYACLYAGVIAVPAYPPEGGADRYAGRLTGILRDAGPRFILTETRLRAAVADALTDGADAHVLAVDAVEADAAAEWRETSLRPDTVAFLQYTSGSTSQPKGVCVSHGNLIANEIAIQAVIGGTPDDVFVSWLPLYHDMGLMGGLLNPLFTGFTAVLMSPRNFLEKPRRWLQAIDCCGGTISGGPDFAFSLCADRISEEAIAQLDLRRWRFAFSGSEFVRRSTLARFAERFKPAGFDRRALTACYGLAEATLLVTGGDRASEAVSHTLDPAALAAGHVVDASEGTDLVACGRRAADHTLRIMRTDASSDAEADEIGEIWVSGPSVAQGYWNNPDATSKTFVERDGARWLRTGDLGFVRNDELIVAGRLRDLLIVRGQNIYPTDIEEAVDAEVASVRKGRVAAFPVEIDGREGIGVAAEFSRPVLKRTSPEALAHAIGEAVVRQTQEYPVVVVLLNPQGMPLTTSGKLQRSACAAGWANDTLDSFMVFERGRRRPGAVLAQHGAELSTTERALAAIWQDALGVPVSGRDDDFFVLGGNSITAAQIAAAVRERFSVELTLRSFFDAPRFAALAAHVDALTQERVDAAVPTLQPAPPDARTILSPAQERLWFLWNMDPTGTAYTVACAIRLVGRLDHALLSQALSEIVRRHEVLRTTFVGRDGRGMQVVRETMDIAIGQEDLRARSPDDQARRIAERTQEELARPFDLVKGPLLRAVLLQLADDRHELLVQAHHIVADGWSLNVLLDELAVHYRSFLHNDHVASAPAPVQYADFAAWQRAWLAGPEGERQLAYWRARLGDTHPVLALPRDRPRPPTQSHAGETVGFEIDSALAMRLRALAMQRRTSVFMLLLAAFQLLLFRYTGQTDLRVGVPVAGRRHAELARLIGCFVNTLVLRAELEEPRTFVQLLDQVKEQVIAALAHQDFPFDWLVDALNPLRSGDHNPLFQAKFNYMTAPRGFDGIDDLVAETSITDLAGSHFDLALDVVDGTDTMKATLNYATDLFDRPTIARIAAQFESLLRQIAGQADRALSDFVIDDGNRQTVARETADFAFSDVLGLYRAASDGRSDAIALRQGGEEISFAELERRSNRIARVLAASGVKHEAPVALWMERSPAFVMALLGVLKAGAAYVPLDPKWPLERVRSILRTGHIKTLIAVGDLLSSALALDCLVLDADRQTALDEPSVAPVVRVIHPAQTAYVIYTSGSTGTPKGVAVSHQALANYVQALLRRLQPAPGASMAMVSTVAADLGHTVLFGALASGATLNLLPADVAFDAEAFARAMRDSEVGILKIVPSHLRGLLQARRSADLLPRDALILGGEACDATLIDEVRRLRPKCRIINHYGPTETTVGAMTHEYAVVDAGEAIPIGLPLANLRAYVLDDALNEVPVGVTGELYIGGAGLARGYRGAPGQTAERFIPDPFEAPGERLYRTGDRARCDRAGRLVFRGRSDDQIKLRGYRIEPGEVARALKSLQDIEDAAIVARATGDNQERQELVAYCVPASDQAPQPDTVKQRMAALVPDYMVPSRVVMIDRLPLTANGKVDRAALPSLDKDVVTAYAAPVGEIEQEIVAVWQDVLGRGRVGRHDNFFELGGDSILSLQIIARLRKRGIRLTPKQVFAQQTIAALAGVAAVAAVPAAKPAATALERSTSSESETAGELLPIQLRFFADDVGNRNHWNQAALLVPRARLDWNVLRQALTAVVDQHDALRLRFVQVGEAWQARPSGVPAGPELLWIRTGVDPADVTAIACAAQESLSLSSGPLLRAVGMELTDGSQRLLIAIHHLVVDGVSWRIVLEDIASACDQLVRGAATVMLPPKGESVASWAARLHAYATSDQLAAELPFWLASTGGGELPCDDDQGGIDRVDDREEVALAFDVEFTARLLNEAPTAYRTRVNDLLLAGLARAVWHWSALDDIVIELEGHGREDIFAGADVGRTVGWFTTAFPVRLRGGASGDAALIKGVKEMLRAVPNHGLGYGVLRYLGTAQHREALSCAAEPRIVFNYLGRFDGVLGEAGPYRIAPESPGPMRSASAPLRAWLTVNGEVREGRLQLSFGHGRRRYRRATIERLAHLYDIALRELVAHCASGACGLTPSDVALSGLDQAALNLLGATIDCRSIEDIYPLSPMQQGMLFHALRDGEDDVYVNQLAIELRGVDPARLREAWQAVSDRHAVLRTGFVWQHASGATQQVVYKQVQVPVIEEDWCGRTAHQEHGLDLAAALADASRREREQGFDIRLPPLQRLRLIRLDDNRLWLIWTHHHIVLDGWSSARLLAEILQHANGGRLPAVQGCCRDYIAWLQTRDREVSAAFWREALLGLETPTSLTDALRSRRAASGMTGHARLTLAVEADLTQRLKAFARRERVTLNTLLQGAWAQLLRQQTGQNAVCFGVTVSGRPADLAGSEDMIGLFINTLPVVDAPHPQRAVGAWLRGLQDQNLSMREHEWMPLHEVQRLTGHAGRALFDSIMVFENYPIDRALVDGGVGSPQIGRVEHVTPTHYAIAVAVFDGVESLRLDFNYDRAHLDESAVRLVSGALRDWLERIAANAEQPLGDLGSACSDELARVLRWSGLVAEEIATPTLSVVARIEMQAAQAPSAIAIVSGADQISYGELNARANALARRLRDWDIGPDRLVGLALNRSVEMIVALLGVLKAGGAYLPLDPGYPSDRLIHMLRDSAASLVLTDGAALERLAPIWRETGVDTWCLDGSARNESDNLDITIHPDGLAYVIYTSGSTGRPKGVAVTHGPLAMHCDAIGRLYGMTARDRELHTASINFDIAHERWLVPLMTGGTLVLPQTRDLVIEDLLNEIKSSNVSVIFVPPAYADELSAALRQHGHTLTLRLCIVGGEAWSDTGVKAFRRVTDIERLVNAYGPTETVIAPMAWAVDETALTPSRYAPIGRPVGQRSAYILDGNLNVVPVGVTGELFIGGAGLARGYLNRFGLTSERFIPDPFDNGGARLYRTGDLARWRPDGIIEYVGRADHQVKIRGFRIELGEIEARLLEQPRVHAAVVVTHGADARRRLTGYVSGEPGLDGRDLRTALAALLPDYMVPSWIVVLSHVPLTSNGKIDRQALPSPEQDGAGMRGYAAPDGEIEIALVRIWAELLGLDRVGRDDHFFELGGHSLLAVRLLSRVVQEFGVSVQLSELFAHPELAEFGRVVSIGLIEREFDTEELQDLIAAGR